MSDSSNDIPIESSPPQDHSHDSDNDEDNSNHISPTDPSNLSYEDDLIDDDHEGSADSGEFTLGKPINPLGGSVYASEDTHDTWNFNLGRVADMATSQLNKATAVAGSIIPSHLYRKKTFSIQFNTKNIPFEFATNSYGSVVVSHVSKTIDPRLHRGVVVVGVNEKVVPPSENASEEMEKLVEGASIPFVVVFEELDETGPAEYEEESNKTDEGSIDEEDHGSGMRRYAGTVSTESESEEGTAPTPTPISVREHHEDLAASVSSSASLLTSSLFSLTSKMRAFVSAPESVSAPQHEKTERGGSEGDSSLGSDDEGQLPENTFELVLSGRSPPFVFDLHADGTSIVVVKLVGDRRSLDPRLQEGCVVRMINSREVLCRSRQEFDSLLSSVEELPLRMVLEHAPALYRHQDALSLFSAAVEQTVHVFTVMPGSKGNRKSPIYDDVYRTSRRGMAVLQAFRAQGVAVALVSMETVLVGDASPYAGCLLQSVRSGGLLSSSGRPLLRAVRVWFRFCEALEVVVDDPVEHLGALEVTRAGGEGGWVVVRCIAAQCPWVEEGMVLGRPYLVTHVNGYDTSASGYRSVDTRVPGDGSWEASILPLFRSGRVKLTVV